MPKWLDTKHAKALEMLESSFNNLSDDFSDLQDIQDELQEKADNMAEKFADKSERYSNLASEVESIKDKLIQAVEDINDAKSEFEGLDLSLE